jgi:hypothetical protein
MSNHKEIPIKFTDKDSFNELCSHVHPEPYREFERLSNLFNSIVKENGPDSFSTTIVVYNAMRKLVGIVAARPASDKSDLYKALSQMLYFPMSLGSELFTVAQDAKVRVIAKDGTNTEVKSDALVITYVTPSDCILFTVPYSVDSNNDVTYLLHDAWVSCVHEDSKGSEKTPVGDMLELFYTFSHSSTTGPFTPHEVLSFLKVNNFNYEIINPQNMTSAYVALPISI